MLRFKRLGMAIPTALFMALVIYFLSTVLTWTAQMNQRFTSGEAERMHHSFATRGEVNTFIAKLRADANWADAHPEGSPVERTEDGYTYKTWAQPDASNPNILQIVCEVDGKLVPFKSARSVVYTLSQGMILYTDLGGTTGPPQIQFLKMDEGSGTTWAPTKPIPQKYYTNAMLDPVTGAPIVDPLTGLPMVNPDPLAPHVLMTLTPPAQIQTFAAYGIGPEGKLIAIYEPPLINAPPGGLQDFPTLFTYDPVSDDWGTPEEITGDYKPTGLVGQRLGGTDGSMVIQDADGLLTRDPTDPSYPAFTRIPNPPGGTITTSTTTGGKTYAQMSDGSIRVYDGSTWGSMISPNADYFTPEGEFVAGGGTTPVSQISVSPNGSITALWQRNGVDTVFRYLPGDSTVDPPVPPHWDANLPLTMEDNPGVPYVSDLNSITAMPGRFITEVPGPPSQIYSGRKLLPSPGANSPVIATGIYTLPNGRYYPTDYSTF